MKKKPILKEQMNRQYYYLFGLSAILMIWPIRYFDAACILYRIAPISIPGNDYDSNFAKSVIYGLYANCVRWKYALECGDYASN